MYSVWQFWNITFANNECKKSTPKHIMMYQISLKQHKLINFQENTSSFEHVTLLHKIICVGRQINYHIHRTSRSKIGMNTTANKLYSLKHWIKETKNNQQKDKPNWLKLQNANFQDKNDSSVFEFEQWLIHVKLY